ncbi:MAG: hypothetical protein WKF37_08435 [Bryobacteraceae bacterium]
MITIKGRNLAPTTALTTRVTNGVVDTTLGEVRVLFDGIPAPLLYVGPSGDRVGDQINLVVPYGIFGRLSSRIVVEYRGVRSEFAEYRVVDTQPGIFTITQTGTGQGAVLNQDNSINSITNPAARGSVISVYATGEGVLTPAGQDGRVITDLRRPQAQVSARINGQAIPQDHIQYAGSVPGLVSGLLQVNIRIPEGFPVTAAASVPLEIQIGTQTSQNGVTVAIRPEICQRCLNPASNTPPGY